MAFKHSIKITVRVLALVMLLMRTSSGFGQFAKLTRSDESIVKLSSTLPDTVRLSIVYDLTFYYIMKPGSEKRDLDSATQLLNKSVPVVDRVGAVSWTARSLLLTSMVLREGGDENKGKVSVEKAISLLKSTEYYELHAYAMLELNQYYGIENDEDLKKKTVLLREAADLFGRAGKVSLEAHTLEVLGDIYTIQDDFFNAVRVLERSLSLYKLAGVTNIFGVYDLLGSAYTMSGDSKKGIEYGLLAVQTAQKVKDTGTIVTLYNRLGISFNLAHLFKEAIFYFEKSLSAARNIGDTSDIILMNINIATVFRRLHEPEQALRRLMEVENNFKISSISTKSSLYLGMISTYTDLKWFPMALIYIEKLKGVEAQSGNRGSIYSALIKYNLATKNYGSVFNYCDSLEMYMKEKNLKAGRQLIHYYRFKADSALQRFIPAIQEYQLYQSIQDSIFGEKNRQNIERLNIAFETDEKDEAIRSNRVQIMALEKSDTLKSEQIDRARLNRNIIIGATLMLLVLLALVYNQFKIKQTSNRNLVTKQDEINRKNLSLQQLVEEKEWLVREIHHRVKNNLQVVMSLLNTQSSYSENEQSFAAIRESRQRMYAMSLIHQKLYQSENLTLVNMANYIPELIDFLRDSFSDGDRVRFELNILPIDLDVSQAVPVGLILNEIVTNSIKYAFPSGVRGIISISLETGDEKQVVLRMGDNGVGLPTDVVPAQGATMGMQLVYTLAQQLGGTLQFFNEGGLVAELVFDRFKTK